MTQGVPAVNGSGKWVLGAATAIIVALASWNFYTVQALQVTVASLERSIAEITDTQLRETTAIQRESDILTDLRIHLGDRDGSKSK